MHGYGSISLLLIVAAKVIHAGPLCVPCEPGYGVIQGCSVDQGTTCEPCKHGFTAPVRSYTDQCTPCTQCTLGEYQVSECTPTTDTVCRSCHDNKDPAIKDACASDNLISDQKIKVRVQRSSGLEENSKREVYDHTEILKEGDDELGSGSPAVAVVFPDWPSSGEPDTPEYSLPPGESSESIDDLLEEEGFLPGDRTTARLPVTAEDNGAGSGSGAGCDVSEEMIFTTRIVVDLIEQKTAGKGYETATTGSPLIEEKTTTQDTPIVDESTGNRISKKARMGIIVGAVVAGVVTVIVSIFFACKLSKRRHKDGKASNTYVVAQQRSPDDHQTRPGTKGRVHSDTTTPSGETGLLAAHNGGPLHAENNYQSPIDIVHGDVTVDTSLTKSPLCFDYPSETRPAVSNTGTTVRIALDKANAGLRGGPLGSKSYRLSHCHFHWGSKDSLGSEHTVDGKQYPGELHLVHWNSSDYASVAEASRAKDGLAVLAVFIQLGEPHEVLGRVTDCLQAIQYKGEATDLSGQPFSATGLLPDTRSDYWSYRGSLPEAPQVDSVQWVIFKQPVEVSTDQIATFRQLRPYEKDEGHDTPGAYLVDNFRRPQAAPGGSTVVASFS